MSINAVQMFVKDSVLSGLTLPAVGAQPGAALVAVVGIPTVDTLAAPHCYIKVRRARFDKVTEGGPAGVSRWIHDVELALLADIVAGSIGQLALDSAFPVWIDTIVGACCALDGIRVLTDAVTGVVSQLQWLAQHGAVDLYDQRSLRDQRVQRFQARIVVQACEHRVP